MIKNKIDDLKLVRKIKSKQCDNSLLELRNRHCGLIISIYSKYSSVLTNLPFVPDEFNQEINHIIYDSARKFDLKRKNIKFSTYLAENTKWFCLNKITELNKYNNKNINSEPDTITKIMDSCLSNINSDNIKNLELCNFIYSIIDQIKDKRVKEIFRLRYFTGDKKKMTWREIGDSMKPKLTAQSIINIHERAVALIKSKISSLEIFDKI